jgi:hypothetical protein
MNFGGGLLRCVNFNRDSLPPHVLSLWIIPHQNLFQSQLTLLGFVSLAVLFQGDQLRPRGLPMGIYFNRQFAPPQSISAALGCLAVSLFVS